MVGNGMGTIRGNSSSYYRAPVVPPSVPSEYLSRQELGIYSSKKELNQSLNADSSYGSYPMPNHYNRASNAQNQSNLHSMSYMMNTSGIQNNPNTSEYSGTDTMDKRMVNAFLQQQLNYPTGNKIAKINLLF